MHTIQWKINAIMNPTLTLVNYDNCISCRKGTVSILYIMIYDSINFDDNDNDNDTMHNHQ